MALLPLGFQHTLYGVEPNLTQVRLIIRQQPKYVRLVTDKASVKNQRPIEPPPVVELEAEKNNEPKLHVINPNLFMKCTLFDEQDNSLPEAQLGTSSSSGHALKDDTRAQGCYFIFNDIFVKGNAKKLYKLHFCLFNLSGAASSGFGQARCVGEVWSQQFEGRLPTDYAHPDTTQLSLSFFDQGVRLRKKKDGRKRSSKHETLEETVDPHVSKRNKEDHDCTQIS